MTRSKKSLQQQVSLSTARHAANTFSVLPKLVGLSSSLLQPKQSTNLSPSLSFFHFLEKLERVVSNKWIIHRGKVTVVLKKFLCETCIWFQCEKKSQFLHSLLHLFPALFSLLAKFRLSFFFILQVLIRHQFYTHQCIHVDLNRPIQHTTIPTSPQFSPLSVHMSILYICVSTSALQTGSSVPFF